MQRKIQREVRERLFRNRSKQKSRMVSAALSVLVVIGTVGGLILPAQTLTRKTQVLDCQYATHTHTEACYAKDDPSNENEEKHLVCGYADYVVHQHDDSCYQDGKLVCTLPEIPEHKHTAECYQDQRELTCTLSESEHHHHTDECYETAKVLTCGQQELHTHTADCYDEKGQLTCGLMQLEQHQHGNACFKTVEQEEPQKEQSEPAPAEAATAQPEANTNESNAPAEAPSASAPATAETPTASAPVTAETPTASAPTQNTKQQETPAAVGMPAQQFDGSTDAVTVHAEAPEGALPEGTTMTVTKVTEKTVIDTVADAVNGKVKAVEAVDITFRNASGQEIEPAKEIRVTMTSKQIAKAEESVVVHVDDKGKAEVVEKKEEKPAENAVVFNADAFSVYALAYTVDFAYEVDGKTYNYSMQGGSAIGLKELLPILGVVKDDTATEKNEVDAFVSDIADVRFSDESLVQVAHVDKDTTVGALKDKLGLDIQYSSELTEEQIAKINAKELKAVDWALISLKAFTSEETLTVTMKNGDQWTVKVTDAQKAYKDIESLENGTYIIYNSFDSGTKYMFMKNDGTSQRISSSDGQALNTSDLSNYTWTVTKNSNGTYTIRSTSNNIYINLYGNNNEYDKYASSTPANVTLVNHYNNDGVNDGISIRYNNKYIQRNQTRGFFVRTDLEWKDVNLTFFKIEENSSGGSTGTPGIVLNDDERNDLEKWKETLEKFNTLTDYDKTAEVYNEDNRIFKINISADSGIMDFYKDVDLGFVLDVSNSMKFPSSLKALEDANGNEQQVWMTADWLNWAKWAYADYYNRQNCFYIISDPALTSTIYKVFLDGNQWKYQDASEPAGSKVFDVNDGTVFKEPYRQAYTLYYADDTKDRFTYLKDSVAYAIETLHKIVKPTEHIDDETASVRLAYNFFCKRITGSESFKDLRDPANVNYTIPLAYNYTDSGTKQNEALYDANNSISGLSANEFGWDTGSDQYVILVTDGAPNGPTMNDVRTAAANLKAQYPNVKIFTIGLSTKDVDGGSQMLHDIADDVDGDGVPEFYEAEKAHDLEYILLKILQTIMAKGLVKGTITDTIDSAFYPVDAQGNPLSVGVYNASGTRVQNVQISDYVSGGKPTADHQDEAFYTWEQFGDEWKITWYNQEIGWNDNDTTTGNRWTGTVYVKAKEDYLGGNLIATNDGNAQIEPTGIKLVINGQPETNWRPLEGMTPIDLPVPRINVHNLETAGNSTTWTVYKGTSVTPKDQIKALWNNIPIEEVVNGTVAGNHKVTTGASANVGTTGTGETFKLADLLTELGSTFNINALTNSLGSGANASVTSDPIIYTAYGHESGTITVTVKREIGTAEVTQHNAETVATPAEKYSLTVTYQPYSESTREGKISSNHESGYTDNTNHHNGSNGRGVEEAGQIKSGNTHTINVIKKALKIKKTNMVGTLLTDSAEFTLYRKAVSGDTSTVHLTNVSGLADGDYVAVAQSTSGGYATFDPVYPIKDTDGTYKQQSTDFWLVETNAPETYSTMPGAVKVTLTLTETKVDKPSGQTNTGLYDWTQSASVTIVADSEASTFYAAPSNTEAETIEFSIKNDKDTDITIIKVDANDNTKTLSGAKFMLMRGSQVVTDATIKSLSSGGAKISLDENNCFELPKEGVKISGLKAGDYTLKEMASPAGYIITEQPMTFKASNGTVSERSDGVTENVVEFRIPNTPGAALPNTGGIGTTIFYVVGSILVIGAGVLLVTKRRMAE